MTKFSLFPLRKYAEYPTLQNHDGKSFGYNVNRYPLNGKRQTVTVQRYKSDQETLAKSFGNDIDVYPDTLLAEMFVIAVLTRDPSSATLCQDTRRLGKQLKKFTLEGRGGIDSFLTLPQNPKP